ncbi:ras-related protein Rab-44 isoform X1 [Cydia pomonella]|uniref:ras-related protein Rab-44 isoform X1 n=1 Tax=Cydia pomonella TaxID=82600 RepID=UPI002ADE458E|nr:ras-related protein Rab-44 isoform X1 [Cydia pomonella]
MRDEESPKPPSPALARSAPVAVGPSRFRRTLHTLRSPFRSGSPFHIGSIKRSGSTKSSDSDGEIVRDERTMRKKNKKLRADAASDASGASRSTDGSPREEKKKKESGGLLKRMGSIGRKREGAGSSPVPTPPPEPVESGPETAPEPLAEPEPSTPITPEPPISAIAVEHAVATRPFTKAAWKRSKSVIEMEKPVEPRAPSPGSALRRRIAFVAQASACFSEDHDDGEGGGETGVGSLEEAVALARVRLASAPAHSPTPSHSRDNNDTEEEGYADTMPPYGDLLDDQKPEPPSHASPSAERREHLYKILVIGELGTGKTSIIKRYVHQFFSQHYRATIGVDFALKVLNWDANTVIRLQLWDIAGQERFGNMTRVYYKEAVGAFIVFDVSRVATFDAVVKWKNDLDTKVQLPDGSPIPCILLANKCDQQKEGIVNSPAKMDEYCRERGFAGWFETSAKENINIEEAARSLVNKILLNDKLLQSSDAKDGDKFALDHKIANGENSRDGGGKSCAC